MILKEYINISNSKDRLTFALKNKKELLKAKTQTDHISKSFVMTPLIAKSISKTHKDAEIQQGLFKIIGNSCGFIDSYGDVSMKGSFTKTVNEQKTKIKILKNHSRDVNDIIAVNKETFIEQIAIRLLGYDADGITEVVGAIIDPKYDDDIRQKYEDGVIDQHSVGIQYIKIDLAVNDPRESEAYKVWVATIDSVINKDVALQNGFYFPVYEQKLIEISAVGFGANPYTPALRNKDNSLDDHEPGNTTHNAIKSNIFSFSQRLL